MPLCCSKERYEEYRNKVENVIGLDSEELRETRRITRVMERFSDISSSRNSGISLKSLNKNSVHPLHIKDTQSSEINKYDF